MDEVEDPQLPWFPLYPGDFLSSDKTSCMGATEVGAYCLLLMYQWKSKDCTLPSDSTRLAKLSRMNGDWDSVAPVVLECFERLEDGRLRNPRLYLEWERSRNLQRKRIEGGKKTANKRWNSSPTSSATSSATAIPQSQSQSHSQIDKGQDTCGVAPATPAGGVPIVVDKVLGTMPTKDGDWAFCQSHLDLLTNTYGEKHGEDWVFSEVKAAKAWLLSNTSNLKTKKGMPRFINGWLKRAYDAGGPEADTRRRMAIAGKADRNQRYTHNRRDGGTTHGIVPINA